MKVTLTFEQGTRNEAFEARVSRGLNKPEDRDTFFGPEFSAVESYSEEGDWFKIYLTDKTIYWYPRWQIVRVKIEQ